MFLSSLRQRLSQSLPGQQLSSLSLARNGIPGVAELWEFFASTPSGGYNTLSTERLSRSKLPNVQNVTAN